MTEHSKKVTHLLIRGVATPDYYFKTGSTHVRHISNVGPCALNTKKNKKNGAVVQAYVNVDLVHHLAVIAVFADAMLLSLRKSNTRSRTRTK